MSRKERLQLEADEAMKAFEASKTPDEGYSSDDNEPQNRPQDSSESLRKELETARSEKAALAREREEFLRERESYSSGLLEKDAAAAVARSEAAELRAQMALIQEEKELALSDEDYSGIDPDIIPTLKKLIEKQSRAISSQESRKLREEMESSFLTRAKGEVLAEVESRQYRSTFDSQLRSDGFDDVYDIINDDKFKDFVKADDMRMMAFTSAASTKDTTSANVIKRLVKDFKEKAVKKPAQTPRIGGRVATAIPDDDGDSTQVDHAQIMKMVKSADPAERKRGKELLNKAAERMASQLSRSRQPAYS